MNAFAQGHRFLFFFAVMISVLSCRTVDSDFTARPDDIIDQLIVNITKAATDEILISQVSLLKYKYVGNPFKIDLFSDSSLTSCAKVYNPEVDEIDKPTHHAIIVYVDDIQDVIKLKEDNNISISSIPFGTTPELSYDSRIRPIVRNSIKRESAMHDDIELSCFVPDNVEIHNRFGPFYVLWPVGKSISEGLSYEYVYDVHIPETSFDELTQMAAIKRGRSIGNNFNYLDSGQNYSAVLYYYDAYLGFTPMSNTEIYLQIPGASYRTTLHTDSTGSFEISSSVDTATIVSYGLASEHVFVLHSSDISNPLLSQLVEVNLGTVGSLWPAGPAEETLYCNLDYTPMLFQSAYYALEDTTNSFRQTFNAVRYLTIFDITNSQLSQLGIDSIAGRRAFYYPGRAAIYTIRNPNEMPMHLWTSTIFHEIGHFLHHSEVTTSFLLQTDSIIKESFGCFSGWYNTEKYYEGKVGISTLPVSHFHNQARQNWTNSITTVQKYYSPVFVDLVDTINQKNGDSSLLLDTLEHVPIHVIRDAIINHSSFKSCSREIMKGVAMREHLYSLHAIHSYLDNYAPFE